MAIFRKGKKVAVGTADIDGKQDALIDRGLYGSTPSDGDYLSGLYKQSGVLGFKSITFSALWSWLIQNRFSKSISASASDLGAPTSKAVLDLVNSRKLYSHNIMLRFNDGNRKAKIQIYTTRSTAYTTADFTAYMKANFADTGANITGNLSSIIPGMGYFKDGSLWYDVIGVTYRTDVGTNGMVCPIIRQVGTASNQIYADSSHAGTYTVTDKVTEV